MVTTVPASTCSPAAASGEDTTWWVPSICSPEIEMLSPAPTIERLASSTVLPTTSGTRDEVARALLLGVEDDGAALGDRLARLGDLAEHLGAVSDDAVFQPADAAFVLGVVQVEVDEVFRLGGDVRELLLGVLRLDAHVGQVSASTAPTIGAATVEP